MYYDPKLGHVIEEVVKNEKGEINAYKLDDGNVVLKEQAVILSKQGAIRGVSSSISKDEDEFLKSLPGNE